MRQQATDFPTEEEANNCTINKKEKKPPPATWQRIIKEVDNSQVSTSPSRGLSHRRQNQKIHQTSLAIRSLPCRAKLWWFFLEPAEMTTKAQWLILITFGDALENQDCGFPFIGFFPANCEGEEGFTEREMRRTESLEPPRNCPVSLPPLSQQSDSLHPWKNMKSSSHQIKDVPVCCGNPPMNPVLTIS
ncbi:hypothetical protein NC652_020854 [Populus alba x Populus x berolinensis]|nr:hypothetical protein NC652_020854 [Populus alba x Populus x berolinensis]